MRESKKVAKEQARREAKEQLKKFKSDTRKKWATKKQKAKEKEMKEIDKEMKEAEAEVDKEERAQVVSITSTAHREAFVLICPSSDRVANGNTKEPVCPILFHPQDTSQDASPPGCPGGHHLFRALYQH